ncbi:hypothetical protein AMTRI_Chr02g216290 [Amborella trichopoda]
MASQRVIIWDVKKHEILLQDAQTLQALAPGMVMKNLSKWELQVNWGRLSIKMSSQATTPEHLP